MSEFASAVIAWQATQGRHHLPWQSTTDAYRIWLSEIMLQQTQVSTVLGYYDRFLKALPTVQDLANAPESQVMSLWAGLGYYSRARNLHACARAVCERFGGRFPADPVALESLPGIGRSTAGAIAALAYGVRAPILDGNVKRVFARHFAIDADLNRSAVQKDLWSLAQSLLPSAHMTAYTQGLMDLGATLCTRSSPACLLCPVQTSCQALAQGRVHELPLPKKKLNRTVEHWAVLLITQSQSIWVQARPREGIWGGLWMAPMVPMVTMPGQGQTFELPAQVWGEPLVHELTHKRLILQPHWVSEAQALPWIKQSEGQWIHWPLKAGSPVPVPLQKFSERFVKDPAPLSGA